MTEETRIGESNGIVLIIGDDDAFSRPLEAHDLKPDFRLRVCGKRDNVFQIIQEDRIKTVVLEAGDENGWEFTLLKLIRTFDALIDVIIIGPPVSSEKVMDWIHLGAADYLNKPVRAGALCSVFGRLREKRALRRETYLLEKKLEEKYQFQGIVGKSPFMLEVFSQVENIAKYFSTVLITGDTGTGKELVAKALHALSPMKDKRFVVCDCVSTPESLFESELFGYRKGAFTGADVNKKGLFEEADGGVIFLDEIGEIPPTVQAKLLRVLETRHFRPLGATDSRRVEVRVIAATNRHLRDEIKKGTFREDLFHRLSKIEIYLPPLKSRPEDIPLLVRFFLEKYAARIGKPVKGVSRQAQKRLLTYPWPGNVRELKNVVESAIVVCQKEFLDIVDLPKRFQGNQVSEAERPFFDGNRAATLKNLESEYIAYQMRLNGLNVRKTAKILNISRSTLYDKLKKYKIPFDRSASRKTAGISDMADFPTTPEQPDQE